MGYTPQQRFMDKLQHFIKYLIKLQRKNQLNKKIVTKHVWRAMNVPKLTAIKNYNGKFNNYK